jgi:hypothetical protein
MATRDRNKPPNELRQEVARSREQLARNMTRFREEVDLPRKFRRSFQRQPVVWMVVLAAVGTGGVVLLSRKKKVYVDSQKASLPKSNLLRTGFILGALRIAANLAKPHIETFLRQKMRGYGGPRQEK